MEASKPRTPSVKTKKKLQQKKANRTGKGKPSRQKTYIRATLAKHHGKH